MLRRYLLIAWSIALLLIMGCAQTVLPPTSTPTDAVQERMETVSPGEVSGTQVLALPLVGGGVRTPTPTATSTATPTATSTATLTPAPTPDSVVFAVIGDYGWGGQPEADVAALVKSWAPDFIITTGDNNYPNGASQTIDDNIGQFYSDYIDPYLGSYGPGAETNRFFPSMGNHDWYTAGAQPYLDYFTLPGNERYYDYVWGPLHLFAVNGDYNEPDGVGASSQQAAWLQAALAASTAPWKIVYSHFPPYSSGVHGPVDWARWPYQEWGATAMLAGHDHTYERLVINGFPYFVNGAGGAPLYLFGNAIPGSEVRYNDDHGAMRVEATQDWIRFEFITRGGQLIDTYTIQTGN